MTLSTGRILDDSVLEHWCAEPKVPVLIPASRWKSAISSVRAEPPNISFSPDHLFARVGAQADSQSNTAPTPQENRMARSFRIHGYQDLEKTTSVWSATIHTDLHLFGMPKPFDHLDVPSTSTPKSQLGQTLGQSNLDMEESMKDELITILTKIRDEYKELSENRTRVLEKLGVLHHQLSKDAQKDLLEIVESQMGHQSQTSSALRGTVEKLEKAKLALRDKRWMKGEQELRNIQQQEMQHTQDLHRELKAAHTEVECVRKRLEKSTSRVTSDSTKVPLKEKTITELERMQAELNLGETNPETCLKELENLDVLKKEEAQITEELKEFQGLPADIAAAEKVNTRNKLDHRPPLSQDTTNRLNATPELAHSEARTRVQPAEEKKKEEFRIRPRERRRASILFWNHPSP
uniref:Uncharacterized protein n=1 Tax=Timema shepardi TaxID=629360 RepID=A0A7R9G1U0_TIMSH|nr:unnamed protein product [Timema shepardi]